MCLVLVRYLHFLVSAVLRVRESSRGKSDEEGKEEEAKIDFFRFRSRLAAKGDYPPSSLLALHLPALDGSNLSRMSLGQPSHSPLSFLLFTRFSQLLSHDDLTPTPTLTVSYSRLSHPS